MIYVIGLWFLGGVAVALYGTRPGSQERGQAVALVAAVLLILLWEQW
ncbi:hypothetical protein [Streptomyces sp. CCM_MD2014]|nr:hypothetical protein [Streptomyces sp. CCM_MD2014]